MTEAPPDRVRPPEKLSVIVFTVQGVTMGADVSQVSELLDVQDAEARQLSMTRLDDCIPFRATSASREPRRALRVRTPRAARAIVVDAADEVADIAIDAIRPLPPLVASAGGSRALWGLATRGDEIVVLVDLEKLERGAGSAGPPATAV